MHGCQGRCGICAPPTPSPAPTEPRETLRELLAPLDGIPFTFDPRRDVTKPGHCDKCGYAPPPPTPPEARPIPGFAMPPSGVMEQVYAAKNAQSCPWCEQGYLRKKIEIGWVHFSERWPDCGYRGCANQSDAPTPPEATASDEGLLRRFEDEAVKYGTALGDEMTTRGEASEQGNKMDAARDALLSRIRQLRAEGERLKNEIRGLIGDCDTYRDRCKVLGKREAEAVQRAREEEREACAKELEQFYPRTTVTMPNGFSVSAIDGGDDTTALIDRMRDAIRARATTTGQEGTT